MPTSPPPSGQPYARGSVLHGFRTGVADVFGEDGLRRLADGLPLDTRLETFDRVVTPLDWVAVAHVMAWHEALWDAAAGRDEGNLERVVARSIEHGVGRMKSAFFSGVTPDRLRDHGPELWRWQHTHGELTTDVENGRGVVTLRAHPYVHNAASRRVTAESYRAILTLAGARDVRVAWGLEAGALVVHLTWRI
jgi:hypothetical protein